MGQAINWFPGHMKKAVDEIIARSKTIDHFLHVVDARCPKASINLNFFERFRNKTTLLVSKADLADPKSSLLWKNYFQNKNIPNLWGDLRNPDFAKQIKNHLINKQKTKTERWKKQGMVQANFLTMVVGLPNLGKTTVINRLAGKRALITGNIPGLTKNQQRINLGKGLQLIDTPGVMVPKTVDFSHGCQLALVRAIASKIIPYQAIIQWLAEFLTQNYPSIYKNQLSQFVEARETTTINKEHENTAFLSDYQLREKAKKLIANFSAGKMGAITLEAP